VGPGIEGLEAPVLSPRRPSHVDAEIRGAASWHTYQPPFPGGWTSLAGSASTPPARRSKSPSDALPGDAIAGSGRAHSWLSRKSPLPPLTTPQPPLVAAPPRALTWGGDSPPKGGERKQPNLPVARAASARRAHPRPRSRASRQAERICMIRQLMPFSIRGMDHGSGGPAEQVCQVRWLSSSRPLEDMHIGCFFPLLPELGVHALPRPLQPKCPMLPLSPSKAG
jgi:hypothetical protein